MILSLGAKSSSTQPEPAASAQATATPVRVTMACGWCGRRVHDLPGVMEVQSGRLRVHRTALVGQAGGRMVCLHCSGPLVLDDWRHASPRDVLRRPAEHRPDDGHIDEASVA